MFISKILDEASRVEQTTTPMPQIEHVTCIAGPIESDLCRLYTVMLRYEAMLTEAIRCNILNIVRSSQFDVEDLDNESPDVVIARNEFMLVHNLFWDEMKVAFPAITDLDVDTKVTITPDWMVGFYEE